MFCGLSVLYSLTCYILIVPVCKTTVESLSLSYKCVHEETRKEVIQLIKSWISLKLGTNAGFDKKMIVAKQ